MSTTNVRQRVNAAPAVVYHALLDANAIAKWKVPRGMTSQVHEFEAREGGTFRVSLTYEEPTATGKSSPATDTYHGHFVKLIPNQQVVEVVEFESDDPAMQGRMTITTTLVANPDGSTEVQGVHEGLPPGVSATDNEMGWRESLQRLAELVERGWTP